jgi:glycerol dehydrogenase-like iron-containing ADH family enzyme
MRFLECVYLNVDDVSNRINMNDSLRSTRKSLRVLVRSAVENFISVAMQMSFLHDVKMRRGSAHIRC